MSHLNNFKKLVIILDDYLLHRLFIYLVNIDNTELIIVVDFEKYFQKNRSES